MKSCLFKSTFCFLFFPTNSLIPKGQVHRRYAHKLHWKCKHHQYNKNTNNTQCLWHCLSLFYFVNFQTENAYSNLYYTIQDTNKCINQKARKEQGINKKIYIEILFMMATHPQQQVIKWIEIFWAFIHNISTLISTLWVKKSIKVIYKDRVHAESRQAQTSKSNSNSKWCKQFKQKGNDSPNCMPWALLLQSIANMHLFGHKYLLLPPQFFQNCFVFCTNMVLLIPLVLLLNLPQLFPYAGNCALNLVIFLLQGFSALDQKHWQTCHAIGLINYLENRT